MIIMHFIFLITDKEEERGVTRAGAPVRPTATHYSLPHDIDYHAFSKFTSIYFKVSHKDGKGRKRDAVV